MKLWKRFNRWTTRHYILCFLLTMGMAWISAMMVDWLEWHSHITWHQAASIRWVLLGIAILSIVGMIRETNKHYSAKEKAYEDSLKR